MPIHTNDPPDGKKVRWEVAIPGKVTWTFHIECFTKEEALAVAISRMENNLDLKPDDEPEPDYGDAEIMAWEDLDPAGDLLPSEPEAA